MTEVSGNEGYAKCAVEAGGDVPRGDRVPDESNVVIVESVVIEDARNTAIRALAEQARALVLAGEFDAARAVVDAAARIATAPQRLPSAASDDDGESTR